MKVPENYRIVSDEEHIKHPFPEDCEVYFINTEGDNVWMTAAFIQRLWKQKEACMHFAVPVDYAFGEAAEVSRCGGQTAALLAFVRRVMEEMPENCETCRYGCADAFRAQRDCPLQQLGDQAAALVGDGG